MYNGRVWADEFLIGAIGMMYNVRITVVSPYFSDVWNVFHDGHAQPVMVHILEVVETILTTSVECKERANLGNVLAVVKQLMKLACTVDSVKGIKQLLTCSPLL